ncbi:hypothetical protein DPMN_140923 [Dreissena polymorpha]|uniref:Uncharacterized protein n=1 Tax=Dreissena polymorpha TaxID=45954 RepID=A0A9D4GBC0_DREPO|nr:hypothetical protein DPMN_140923 [Dreissena polymorpha]
MARDLVHFLGHSFSSKIFWHRAFSVAVVASPPCLFSSERTLSTTGDFPALRLYTESSNSAFSMDGLSSSASDLGSY